MDAELGKAAAGLKAAEWIESGMIVGLGTGSTAAYFIQALGKRCREGLQIKAVASSVRSAQLAVSEKIPLFEFNSLPRVDITVDGADEIDPLKRMIKGGGGALLQEKILASSSAEMVVLVDETKLVENLGGCRLPIEVIRYGSPATRAKIERAGYKGEWRKSKEGSLYLTENNNYLFDLSFPRPLLSPENEHEFLLHIPGVVETGFFFGLAGRVIIGRLDGSVELR